MGGGRGGESPMSNIYVNAFAPGEGAFDQKKILILSTKYKDSKVMASRIDR